MEDGLGELYKDSKLDVIKNVLILVLVEDGLGAVWDVQVRRFGTVLILVLVEDGLGAHQQWKQILHSTRVLILVLVEDGLGVGRLFEAYKEVLILVLVEDGLGAPANLSNDYRYPVLILVLVEDGLGDVRLKRL